MTLIRVLFALALLTGSAGAADFAIGAADERLDDAIHTCNEGENHDGDAVKPERRISACQDAIVLLVEISSNGYCYDEAKDAWRECQFKKD